MSALHWRGFGRLAADGVVGATHLVEAMHVEILRRIPFIGEVASQGLGGISGQVYRSVRGVARGAGFGLDLLLQWTTTPEGWRGPDESGVRRWRAIVNGVVGDHLLASANPLAIPMRLLHQGEVLALDRASLARSELAQSSRLVILVHGLCMTAGQWQRQAHDHGQALQRDLGLTPLYLEYNTGLHISRNGHDFAALLRQLVAHWPTRIEQLVIVGHSLGGLVTRSACHQARAARHEWPRALTDLIFLGTPHQGATLARVGHHVEQIMRETPYVAPLAMLGAARSAGIVDLRRADLLEADWRDGRHAPRTPVPLPRGVRSRAIAAALHEPRAKRARQVIGDGLVPVASALGEHPDPTQALDFAPDSRCVIEDAGHFDLLSDARVYQQMREWLAEPAVKRARGVRRKR